MERCILLRHPKSGAENIYYGQNEVPLREEGKVQAGEVLRKVNGKSFSLVATSPLSRCHFLARSICGITDSPIEIVPEMIEIHIGDFQGKPITDEGRVFKEIARQFREKDFSLQFPGGESLSEFQERIIHGWQNFVKEHRDVGGTVLFVIHAGVIRALMSYLEVAEESMWHRLIDNCTATLVEFNGHPEGRITNVAVPLEEVL